MYSLYFVISNTSNTGFQGQCRPQSDIIICFKHEPIPRPIDAEASFWSSKNLNFTGLLSVLLHRNKTHVTSNYAFSPCFKYKPNSISRIGFNTCKNYLKIYKTIVEVDCSNTQCVYVICEFVYVCVMCGFF